MNTYAEWQDNNNRLLVSGNAACERVAIEISGKVVEMSWESFRQFMIDLNASLAIVARIRREAEFAPQVA